VGRQRQEVPALHRQEIDRRGRTDRCVPTASPQQHELAKVIARPERRELGFSSARRFPHDLHLAADDQVEAGADVALPHDGLAGLVMEAQYRSGALQP
jgi:hypothetical protein